MSIDKDEVRRIARLAHLEYPRVQNANKEWVEPEQHLLSGALLQQLSTDLAKILEHVEVLSEVDVEGVEPCAHGVPLPTALREDEAGQILSPDESLGGAPARFGDAFSVPKVVE